MAKIRLKQKNLREVVQDARSKVSETQLNEAQHNLLRLCRLLIDIEYRHKYGNNEATTK